MDKGKAIQLLKEALSEIPHLKELKYDDPEFQLWRDKVEQIIKSGLSQDDFKTFISTNLPILIFDFLTTSTARQDDYLKRLVEYGVNIEKIIQKYKILGIEEEPASEKPIKEEKPKVFIAHGGKSEARDKLFRFLTALGTTPLIIDEEPREGRSVNEQVEYYSEQADCAIILGTADDKELKDGKLYPRRNVHIEIGRFQEKFPNKIIYLLEDGASFPSNISEKLYTPFTKDSLDEAFMTIARELTEMKILKAVKPQ